MRQGCDIRTFTNPEHLGAASMAGPLRSGLAILHSDGLGLFHLFLFFTFNTIGIHPTNLRK